DGVGAVRSDFEELDDPFVELLQRGGGFGIHVVAAMTRWNELRMNTQPLIGTRVELRLNDPSDSSIARKLSATLRADQPGRVLTDASLFAQVALPLPADGAEVAVGAGLEELAARSREAWAGPQAPPIRL